jgi:hypothetical protein
MSDDEGFRILPLHVTGTAQWALLTCPHHRAGDVEIEREGAFYKVRCRECARAAEQSAR